MTPPIRGGFEENQLRRTPPKTGRVCYYVSVKVRNSQTGLMHQRAMKKYKEKKEEETMQDYVLSKIKEIAAKFDIEKVILFGSRARGDHSKTSDYDIAILGKDIPLVDQALLREAMEEINTLKKLDVVFIDEDSDKELAENIRSEGVVIYEQI